MCAPCKIILNNGGLTGTLSGIEKAITHLNTRGYDLAPETYHLLVKIICGAHEELQQAEEFIFNGPFVPFEHKIIELSVKV